MDVVRLDSSYLPDSLVEDYSSMVWTERFFTNGDFKLNTAKIDETRDLIPEGSFISLLDSEEVMEVETHNIKVNDAGVHELEITGRTFETEYENRVATGVHSEPWSTVKNYKTSEVLALLMWTYLVDWTGQDVSRPTETHDAADRVLHLVVTDSSTLTETPKQWSLQEGDVYAQIKGIQGLAPLGIRGIRPPGSDGYVMSFDTLVGSTRGDITKTFVSDISDMRLDVYNGVDRSRFQSAVEPVIFHYDSGHIESPSYLFSVKDFKNVAIVSSSLGNTVVWPETGTTPPGAPPTGLNRRVLFVDGGTQGDTDLTVFTDSVIQKGMVELAKHNQTIMFDGAISQVSPYRYGRDYFLGDVVSLMAQYGFEAEMVVAEYVRTQDVAGGDRGYPTLILAN